ncbi:MAG: hypothetical protein N4A43_01965 [Alphaproteobacteria bacterium]|jgi:hypothetical protein|nr:hypothetical protein [Alphaproteobacteria bacterium]
MTTQKINVGTIANDDTGDSIRAAFQKCNSNFESLDVNKASITQNTNDITTNKTNISNNTATIAIKANSEDILKKDGSVELNSSYTPISDYGITTKKYVDESTAQITINKSNISSNTSSLVNKAESSEVLKKDGSVNIDTGYIPSHNLSIATKGYVDDVKTLTLSNQAAISNNTASIATKANSADILKKDGSISLIDGYTPNLSLDIATKKYVDDVTSSIDGGSGASETDLLTISSDSEKLTGGISDTKQSDWNIRAKSKIEANSSSIGSKASQSSVDTLTTRVTTAETKITDNKNNLTNLATVANSGSYNDLTNKPNIPANTSDITNDSGFVSNLNSFNSDNLSEGVQNLYDKTVTINGGIDISVTGTYPNFTVNSTTSGGISSPNMICGGVISNNSSNPDEIIDISSFKARSSNDTQDIIVSSNSINITLNSSWANGITPTLSNASIHLWADYNSGTPRFILDDVNGSNISGAKRRVASFITDSDGDVIPFDSFATANGGLEVIYKHPIYNNIGEPTVATKINLSIPKGLILNPLVINKLTHKNSGWSNHYFWSGYKSSTPRPEFFLTLENDLIEQQSINLNGIKTNNDAQIWYVKFTSSGNISINQLFTNGYIDERI